MPPPGLGSSWAIFENLTSMGSVASNSEGDSVRIIVEPVGGQDNNRSIIEIYNCLLLQKKKIEIKILKNK